MRFSYGIGVKALLVGSLCLLLGCNAQPERGPTVTVNGKVTLNGEPFSAASIRFTSPSTGASFPMDLREDGTYEMDLLDTHEGEAFLVSFGPILKPPEKVELDAAGLPKPNPQPPIPEKYWEDATSGLTAKLSAEPTQTFNFDL